MTQKLVVKPNTDFKINVRLGIDPKFEKIGYTILINTTEAKTGTFKIENKGGTKSLIWKTETITWPKEHGDPSLMVIKQEFYQREIKIINRGGLIVDWIDINGLKIKGNSPWVSASRGWKAWFDQTGKIRETWEGELIIDVDNARKNLNIKKSELPFTAHEIRAYIDTSTTSFINNKLYLTLQEDDLKNSRFIDELQLLKQYVQKFGGKKDNANYARLNIDIGHWADICILNSRGHSVEINTIAPRVAPALENQIGQMPVKLNISSEYFDPLLFTNHVFQFSHLPPGTLLDCGKNLSEGIWQLKLDDIKRVMLTPPDNNFSNFRFTVNETAVSIKTNERVKRQFGIFFSKNLTYQCLPPVSVPKPISLQEILNEINKSLSGLKNFCYTISSLPPGTLLTNGVNHGAGIWVIEGGNAEKLTLYPPHFVKYPFKISLQAAGENPETGNKIIIKRPIQIYWESAEYIRN